ncbi:sugar porter family MFS transporter [Croceivirga sp. JEA036]|uniref:sugar porter family MFS transporter n=1 Tax=Croceivirga sp. JEA036 TaxID=2721162 RepID=UPI001ADA4F75|nr:sugar porter family MFS transporter [Croceivirga sp. JEA036]
MPKQTNAYKYSFIVAIGGLIFGLDAALISGTINFITKEFALSDIQLGTAVSAPALGVLLALPFAGYACDKFGRKKTLIIVAFLYLFSAIFSALAPNYFTLVAARFIGGLAFSSISLASMYIGEIAPPKLRGKLVSMTQINIVIGLSAAYFINYLILDWSTATSGWAVDYGLTTNVWRWMLGSEIIPALIWFLLLFTIPESPSWYLLKNRKEEATKVLTNLMPLTEIPKYVNENLERIHSKTKELSIVEQLKGVFTKRMRVILIIATTIAIAQQATGINAILFYAPTVFEQLGLGTDAAFAQAIWIGLVSIVFTILAILLVDRLGRRPMIIAGMLWIVASLVLCWYGFSLAEYSLTPEALIALKDVPNIEQLNNLVGVVYDSDLAFKNALAENLGEATARDYAGVFLEKCTTLNATLILVGLLSFIGAFHFSVGPLMWVLFSEIFPVSIRGIAIPFFTIITSLTNWLVQQFFPWQLNNMGVGAIFLFYASIVAIGLIILSIYLKETKGLTIEEIQKTLQGNK